MPGSRLLLPLAGALVATAMLLAPAAPAKRIAAVPKTTITVLAGKPSELAFKLSKLSNIKAGTVVFKVKNDGVAFHTFKICTSPAKSDARNACVGKVTPVLKHGKSATLTVVLKKKGLYEYLCSVAGHAAAGMKGLIGVGVTVSSSALAPKSAASQPTSAKSSSTSSPTSSVSSSSSTPSASPAPAPAPAPAGGGAASECPPGQTIAANGPGDQDDDDTGAVSDGDGCI